jgi:hypothetical protein
MTVDEVAAVALALDDVRETGCSGKRRWYVRNRLVAREVDAGSIVIRCDFPERERLVIAHPDTFTITPRFEAHMMVVADLRRGEPEAITAAVRTAWAWQRR